MVEDVEQRRIEFISAVAAAKAQQEVDTEANEAVGGQQRDRSKRSRYRLRHHQR